MLDKLVREGVAGEGAALHITLEIPPQLRVSEDPTLLARAIAHVLRNSGIHAGPAVTISATATADGGLAVTLTLPQGMPELRHRGCRTGAGL
ncbi:MAG: hypothetical protein WCO57_02225, partial [Verrucomicrobiota bacterium]